MLTRSALLAALLLSASAAGATVYKWTDARGIVHFSDVPPPTTSGIKAETMPEAPPPVARPPAPPIAPQEAPKTEEQPGDAAAPTGPAQVVLTDQQAETIRPTVQSFSGKVKNRGGVEARDVFITIRVTEPTQGDECVRDEIDVEPSTLAPGAEGTFSAEFESPCFHGPVTAELGAVWK
jgi:hypothetical protein